MRFLYSHRTRSADGQYVHIRELTEALRAEGVALTLCGPEGVSDTADTAPRTLDAGAGEPSPWRRFIPKALYELAELAYSLPAFWRLRGAAQEAAPDILYERYNLFFLAGLWQRALTKRPLILEVNSPLLAERTKHGGLALKPLARWTEQAVWRAADALLPVTEALAEDLRRAGVPDTKITVIPNGVSAPFLAPADPAPLRERFRLGQKTVLGFSGFVRDWHGVDLVLDFMAARPSTALHLLLVGEGPAVPDLKAQAERLNLSEHFTVTGTVQREAMPAHLACFDVALQPRVTAYASPLKLFEYMAQGRAVIAPDQANIREVMTDGQTGLLFAPEDRHDFFEKLEKMIADQALRTHLGAGARDWIISTDRTWRGNARKVIEIAQSLRDAD